MKRFLQSMILLIVCLTALSGDAILAGSVPQVIPYHGRLTDLNGFPITEPTEISFAIYSDSTAPVSLWAETAEIIPGKDGSFTHLLGYVTPFDASLFDGRILYLGLTITGNEEMSPRFPIASVPYALGSDVQQIEPNDVIGTAATLLGNNYLMGTNVFSGPAIFNYSDPAEEALRAENSGGGSGLKVLTNSDSVAALTAITGLFTSSPPGSSGGTGPIIEGYSARYSLAEGVELTRRFAVENDGTVTTSGNYLSAGSGLAEMVPMSGNTSNYETGDVIEIDRDNPGTFRLSSGARSNLVAGIYCDHPGFVDQQSGTQKLGNELPLAVSGIVLCHVTDEGGPITAGDLLVTSSTPGYAMRDSAPGVGTIVGKALENHNSGTGQIRVLVTLR